MSQKAQKIASSIITDEIDNEILNAMRKVDSKNVI